VAHHLTIILDKAPTESHNWAHAPWQVAKFPTGLPATYEYYQADNRDYFHGNFSSLEKLRDAITEYMPRKDLQKAVLMFVTIPQKIDPETYLSLLRVVNLKVRDIKNYNFFPNCPGKFTYDRLCLFLFSLARILPFVHALLLPKGMISKGYPCWTTLGSFIEFFLRNLGGGEAAVDTTFEEKIEVLFHNISEAIVCKVGRLPAIKVVEGNADVKAAVSATIANLKSVEEVVGSMPPTAEKSFTAMDVTYKLRYYNQCFFQFARSFNEKFQLVIADIPYICTKGTFQLIQGTYEFDTLKFVGDSVFDDGFQTSDQYFRELLRAVMAVAANDSFVFLFCGFEQQFPLYTLFSENGFNVTPCFVHRKAFPNQIRRRETSGPLNEVEVALFMKRGNPTWANYGIIRLIIGTKPDGTPRPYISNFFNPSWPPAHATHPFNKPAMMYKTLMSMFSLPTHNVLEAFAGTCPSVGPAVTLGRNLYLVEKDKNQVNLFHERYAQVNEWISIKLQKDEEARKARAGALKRPSEPVGQSSSQAKKLKSLAAGSTRVSERQTRKQYLSPEIVPPSEGEGSNDEESEGQTNPLVDVEAIEVPEGYESQPEQESEGPGEDLDDEDEGSLAEEEPEEDPDYFDVEGVSEQQLVEAATSAESVVQTPVQRTPEPVQTAGPVHSTPGPSQPKTIVKISELPKKGRAKKSK
jgi:DNA modification methylase